MQQTRRRRIVFALSAVGLGVLLALVSAESALRYLLGPPELPTPPGLMVADPILGTRMTPEYDGIHQMREYRTRVRTNAQGYRDAEWIAPDSSVTDRRRVLALGDSFAFGSGVEYADNFLTLVETAGDKGFVVLNAGIPAWGPPQEVALAERLIPQQMPGVAILVFFVGNDFSDALLERGGAIPYRGVLLSREQFESRSVITPMKVFARKHCKTYEATRDVLRGIARGPAERFKHHFPHMEVCRILPKPSIKATGQCEAVRQALLRFQDVCRRADVRAGLVVIPSRFQVSEAYRRRILKALRMRDGDFAIDFPNRFLKEVADQLELPLLDYLEPIQKLPDPDLLYFRRDNHWNRAGHRYATSALADFLTQLAGEATIRSSP